MKFSLEFQFLVILILCENITRKCKRLQSPVRGRPRPRAATMRPKKNEKFARFVRS